MKLIVGLGNPGKEYALNRHNAGFMAVDAFASLLEAEWQKDIKRHAACAKAKVASGSIVLAKPQTFMNESGLAVRELVNFYKLDPAKDLLVVQDEMDFEAGRFALAKNSGSAGHNGIQSIIENLGRSDFARLRIGIGRPDKLKGEDWVLSDLDPELMQIIRQRAPEALADWLDKDFEQAATLWNKK